MIVTTDSIVLRARKQGETSKIVTLYTLDYGKLNVIAKGAREVKSKFGGALEMFARTSAVFYKKEKQDGLYLLSKADTIQSNAKILQSLDRMETATAIVELVLRSMHDEEANPEIFALLADTLHAIAEAHNDDSATSLQFRFYLEFARIMGFEMNLKEDDSLTNRECSPESIMALRYLCGSTFDKACSLRISERAKSELSHFFNAYFTEHLPGMTSRSMKSGKVFSSL
jgi:recombinational DNA repair protein (RecF pathway)